MSVLNNLFKTGQIELVSGLIADRKVMLENSDTSTDRQYEAQLVSYLVNVNLSDIVVSKIYQKSVHWAVRRTKETTLSLIEAYVSSRV